MHMKSVQEITYVDKSKIHGNGLYARVPIGKGTIIGKIKGRPCQVDGSHVLWLTESEGFEVSCNLKYINHANNPNACYYDDLSVVALRDIAQHEEITHDYETADW